jgi:hypothetical protein
MVGSCCGQSYHVAPGLVAELLPKLRNLRVTAVTRSSEGFAVSFVHQHHGAAHPFKIFYAAYPPPSQVPHGHLQQLRYEGNGVHVLKFRGHPSLAGTVVGIDNLTFATPLHLKSSRDNQN